MLPLSQKGGKGTFAKTTLLQNRPFVAPRTDRRSKHTSHARASDPFLPFSPFSYHREAGHNSEGSFFWCSFSRVCRQTPPATLFCEPLKLRDFRRERPSDLSKAPHRWRPYRQTLRAQGTTYSQSSSLLTHLLLKSCGSLSITNQWIDEYRCQANQCEMNSCCFRFRIYVDINWDKFCDFCIHAYMWIIFLTSTCDK